MKQKGKKILHLAILLILCVLTTSGVLTTTNTQKSKSPNKSKSKPPNVLMLCIDDMNDWVGFLGGHPQTKTPNMDKLAKKGVNFTKAYCTAPGCSPSRNAVLFGIEPHNSGLYPFYNINKIEPSVLEPYTALPLLFRENGYETIGLSKVFHNPDNSYKKDELWDYYKMYSSNKLNLIKENL